MTRIVYFVLFVIFFSAFDSAQAQRRRKERVLSPDASCVKKYNYSLKKRLDKYPFNVSAEVRFISFLDTISTHSGDIPVINGALHNDKVTSSHVLNAEGLDKLTHILYDYVSYGGVVNTNCYSPHHGILFMSADGRVLEYIEICFWCNEMRTSSDAVDIGYYCYEKYNMLENLFRSVGIKLLENPNH